MRRLTSQRPWAKTIEPGSGVQMKHCRLLGPLSPSYWTSVTILHVTTAPGTNLRRQVRVV